MAFCIIDRDEVGLLLVDLYRAFDLVNHILLEKMKLYKSCSEKTQRGFYHISQPVPVKCGRPMHQGSILGRLLLFSLYERYFSKKALEQYVYLQMM